MVVPRMIQMMWPNKIQDTKALMSSVLNGRTVRIDAHLNRTARRDQNPFAARRNSSLVGRWMCGKRLSRCLLAFVVDAATVDLSATPLCPCKPSLAGSFDGSFAGPPLLSLLLCRLSALPPGPVFLVRPGLVASRNLELCHACRAGLVILYCDFLCGKGDLSEKRGDRRT